MRRSLLMAGIALGMIGAWFIGRVQAEPQMGKVVFSESSHGTYNEMERSNGMVSTAAIWGDQNAGAHGTWSKFAPGYDAGWHTHTNDTWLVVLKGAYLYKDEAGEKRVGVGDFIRVPGGHKHWSGGDKKEGALFYEESNGKFDLIPVK